MSASQGALPDRGAASPFAPRTAAALTPSERKFPLAPEEGWLTVLLVFLLVIPLAWSIDDARWVLGQQELTRFLPWAVLGGAAWGMLGAKVGWGRWTTHLLGAVVAAIVVPLLVGMVLVSTDGSLFAWYTASATAAVEAVLDFTVRNRTVTSQFGHHLLVLGFLCWGTAQFAGFATLGHRRPLGAVFITGLVLLGNMAITIRDQMAFLVIFSLAALLLLVRVHADDERTNWLQRRIGDPAAVTGLYLRGGAVFVTVAVAGSLLLTSAAASAPLAGAFAGMGDKLVDFGQQIQRFLPIGGPGTKISGVSFGPTASIQGRWETSQTPALEITVPVNDPTAYYWKAASYDTFVYPATWTISSTNTHETVPAGTSILKGTGDQVPSPDLRKTLTFSVRKLNYAGKTIFAPDAVDTIDLSTNLTVVGSGDNFGALESTDSWSSYNATALVIRNAENGFTENKLRAASVDYPDDIRSTYLPPIPGGTFGPASTRLVTEIKTAAFAACIARNSSQGDPNAFCTTNAYDPYDLALAAQNVLRSNEFSYDTDVTDLKCDAVSIVECFAQFKRGYCQYYATTMAMIMRSFGVPTRFVQGWLPSTPDPKTGVETILLSNSHAWVEVYFPGFGWKMFDPTGNGQTAPEQLVPGAVVPSASPRTSSPRPSGSRPINEPDVRSGRPFVPGTASTSSSGTTAGLIVVAVLIIFAMGLLAFVAYQRGPRGPTQPESAWTAMVRLAARFGWAPRPTQTPFEYAGALGDILPVARADLHVVAAAKVEVAYGRKTLDQDRLAGLRNAQRKLRVSLLRLAFRRPKRGSRMRRL